MQFSRKIFCGISTSGNFSCGTFLEAELILAQVAQVAESSAFSLCKFSYYCINKNVSLSDVVLSIYVVAPVTLQPCGGSGVEVRLRGFERWYPGTPQALTLPKVWVLLIAFWVRASQRAVPGTWSLTQLYQHSSRGPFNSGVFSIGHNVRLADILSSYTSKLRLSSIIYNQYNLFLCTLLIF